MLTKCVEMGRVSYSDHFSLPFFIFSLSNSNAYYNTWIGHIGTSHFVLYREVVLSLEVKMYYIV